MDEYRENVRKVQKALNQDAAFLQPNPYLAQRVLNAANAEGIGKGKVRRKLSLSLLIVIVMLLLTVSAVAAVWLSMRDVVEDYAIPLAQEQEEISFSAEDTNTLLQLAHENQISQAGMERINYALKQDKGYYKDELIKELAKSEFGDNPLSWSLEQQKWYADVCKALGIDDGIEPVLPEDAEAATTQAIGWAKAHIQEKHGESMDALGDSRYVIGVQYTNGCEEIAYTGMCWTVWFSPRALEYPEYVVYMDDHGAILELTDRPGLSANSNVNDIYHTYEKIYGDSNQWGQDVLVAFREAVLKSPDQNHQAYLCMIHTNYPAVSPANAISRNAAIDIAAKHLGAEAYIVAGIYLIETDENPVWKLRLNTGEEQWSFEIDCLSGEIVAIREIGLGDTKWWMPIVRWKVVDEVRENWGDNSPAYG